MNSTSHKFAISLMCVLVSLLLLAACRGGGSKESIAGEMWDCQAERDTDFEESMLMMFATADDIDEAKQQYVSAATVVPLADLEEARDEVCSGDAP